MKRYLMIFFVLLYAICAYSQTTLPNNLPVPFPIDQYGKSVSVTTYVDSAGGTWKVYFYKPLLKTDTLKVNQSGSWTVVIPDTETIGIRGIPTVAPNGGYFAVQDSWNWVRYQGGKSYTITAVDSITPTSTSLWWKPSIYATDSVRVSSDRTFPATDATIIIPGQSYTPEKLNLTYFPKLYIKPVTGSTSTRVTYSWWGF